MQKNMKAIFDGLYVLLKLYNFLFYILDVIIVFNITLNTRW